MPAVPVVANGVTAWTNKSEESPLYEQKEVQQRQIPDSIDEPSLLQRRRRKQGSDVESKTTTEPISVPLSLGHRQILHTANHVDFSPTSTDPQPSPWLPEMSPFQETFASQTATPMPFQSRERSTDASVDSDGLDIDLVDTPQRSPASSPILIPSPSHPRPPPSNRASLRPIIEIPSTRSARRISSIPEGQPARLSASPEGSPTLPSALPSPSLHAASEPASFTEGSRWGSSRNNRGSQRMGTSYAGEPDSFGRSRRRRQSSRMSSTTSGSPAGSFLSSFAAFGQQAPGQPDDEGQCIGDYTLGKQIGFGGFSIVREAIYVQGQRKIRRAMKIVRRLVDRKNALENEMIQKQFGHEVVLWRRLEHRNILPLLAVYETSFATCCISPLNTGGTLFDLVNRERSGLPARTIQWYAYQLAEAIRYLHREARVVHRDIKLENCLIDTGGEGDIDRARLLLCDFGLAEFLDEGQQEHDAWLARRNPRLAEGEASMRKLASPGESATFIFTGSLQYASPELVASGSMSGIPVKSYAASDVWAFGVILYALTVGYLPFQHTLPAKVYQLILRGQYDRGALIAADEKRGLDGQVVRCVEGCFESDSQDRLDVEALLDTEFMVAAMRLSE